MLTSTSWYQREMLVRIDGLGPPSTIFVYKDAAGHVTQFQPPDWLLLHTSSIPWHQVGPLDSEEWDLAICKFLVVMRNRKAIEWTDIKELTPLEFMPYVANLFREVTGKDLQGLGQFTGWIGLGGYYHWKVAQQGLLHTIPHLQGQPVPQGPIPRPSS